MASSGVYAEDDSGEDKGIQSKATDPQKARMLHPTSTFAMEAYTEENPTHGQEECGSAWVMTENNPFRVAWSLITVFFLVYLATIYLYHLSFHTFHIRLDANAYDEDVANGQALFWRAMDVMVEIVFLVDIVINFFESYKDHRGMQVVNLSQIAKNYLLGNFIMDLLASIPEFVGQALITLLVGDGSGSQQAVEASRLVKLQRMQRLTRLMRLSRVARCMFASGGKHSPFMSRIQKFRGTRIVKFLCCLTWVIHLMACGWYIVASLHSEPLNTWVCRRSVNPDGDMLVDQPAIEQWLHSMYFVLTVFTTVGFGDMYPVTELEIVYVALVMVVGAVVHSIVISEVISIVTSTDRLYDFKEDKFKVVEAFAAHTELEDEMVDDMKAQITYRAKYLMENNQDKGDMLKLITGKFFSRWFIGTLPDALFAGRVKRNQFLTQATELTPGREVVPPSLVCLLSIYLNQFQYEAGEVVFQKLDYPFYMYLVLKGSFANVGIPSPTGGIDAGPSDMAQANDGALSTQSGANNAKPSRMSVTEKEGMHHVYPYRVYSFNCYFGDFELLPGRPKTRSATVRCETAHATALGLAKDDFHTVIERFPQYSSPWVILGQRRDCCRIQQRKRLRQGLPLKSFAARCIQNQWRKVRTRLINHDVSADNASPSHEMDKVFSMRPVPGQGGQAGNVAATPGTVPGAGTGTGNVTCGRNGQCCQDMGKAARDIAELKDTMRLMVKEVASLSRTVQSMRNERGKPAQQQEHF